MVCGDVSGVATGVVPLHICTSRLQSMAAFASQTTWLPPPDAPLATAPLSRFLRVPDPELETIHDALWDLKQALALQCVFLAGCCSRARAAATNVTSSGKLGALLGGAEAASSAVTVGIIGGGIIGGVVAHALLDAGLPPHTVVMSTRSPRRQEDLAARGVAVVFDNALVASKAHLLIIAVLPAQLQDVAKSMRPAPHALVLSLAGATPLAKVRQLFDSPHAVASSADATLPLIMQAQGSQASVAAGGVHVDGLVAGRLPPEKLLELAAAGFVRFSRCLKHLSLPSTRRCVRPGSLCRPHPLPWQASSVLSLARHARALRGALGDLELPPAVTLKIATEALYGQLPRGVLTAVSAELDATDEVVEVSPASAPEEGQDRDAVMRAREAFVDRIRAHGASSKGQGS